MYLVKMTIKKLLSPEGNTTSKNGEAISVKVKDEDIKQFTNVVTQSFCAGEAERKLIKEK